MMVDVQCYEGRSLDTVTQAETLASWGDVLARDYTTYTAATAMLETADRLTEEREPSLQQYLLLAGALRSMAEGAHDPGLVLDAYLLRALAIAGWAPSFHDCARCGADGPHRAFNLAAGGGWACRPPGSRRRRRRRSPSSRPCWPGTGRWPTPPRSAPSRGQPVSRRPSCSGTSSAACARCGSSSGSIPLRRPNSSSRRCCNRPRSESRPKRERPYERPSHPSGARPPQLPAELVPGHIAVVMDGNGRWANQRGLPRTKGHEAGEAALLDVVAGAIEAGVTHLSAYAFSTENWKRSPDEVRFLMGFNRDVIRRRRDQLHSWGVRMRWVGRRPGCGARSSRSSRSPRS